MASDAENLTEGQTETSENEDQELEESTETDGESEGEGESTSDESGEEAPASKYDSRLAALEAQLTRSNEDRDTLRESLRLTQQLAERQNRPAEKTPKQLTEEQRALKDLGLAFGDDIQGAMEPLVGTVSKLFDSNDAVSFQLDMTRLNPELMKGDKFDKLAQTVESVRRQYAQSTGQYLPRMDAYKYAKGSGMLDTILAVKPVVESNDDAAETKRKSEVKQAGNGLKTSAKNKGVDNGGAEIQKIRDKAQSGVRLTPAERAKFRAYLSDKSF